MLKEQNIQDPVHKKIVKHSDFQFSFNPIYKKFVREIRDEDSKLFFFDLSRFRSLG
jgi:hypothetical protein